MINRYAMQHKVGNIFAGEADQIWLPETSRGASKYGVVLLHGATSPMAYADHTRWGSAQIAPALARAGIPVVAGTMGGDTFANDTSMSRILAAITYLATTAGCHPTKVHLIGASMGAGLGTRFAGLYPEKVASLTGIIPLVNIDAIYQANILGMRASIGTAWGVTYPDPLPLQSNLLLNSAPQVNAANIPVRLYYSDADAAINPADVTAMGTAIGAQLVQEHDPTNSGHTETTINAIGTLGDGDWSEIVDFVLANGA